MNTPDDAPIDIEEVRAWLMTYKTQTGLSWPALAAASGIKQGTISPFGSGIYQGRNDLVAREVFKFRQKVQSQAEYSAQLATAPTFIETPTARKLKTLLVMAQHGEMTLGATAPGLGKTITIRHYQACVANVWVVTCRPTTAGLTAMIGDTLAAVGAINGGNWTRKMSAEVITAVRGKGGVLVYDEANHLTTESIEEIRAWHDVTGVGVCLMGNEELFAKVRGGARTHGFARLNSRIKYSHLAELPEQEDIDAYLDAWGMNDPVMRRQMVAVGMTPGTGGLREIRQIIEVANMLAETDGVPVALAHLREAQSTRSTRNIRVPS